LESSATSESMCTAPGSLDTREPVGGYPDSTPLPQDRSWSRRPIKSFRRAWLTACTAAGLSGRIPHDFRRTAVRNLERAGVPRSTAMKMVGHKTESIYRRYAIVDEAMLKEGAAKLPRGPGARGPRHPADQGDRHEARQFEYRPSQPGAARAPGPGGAR